MTDFNWGTFGVITTEETTTLFNEEQKSFDIWTVEPNNNGAIIPKLLGTQLGLTFVEAVRVWASLEETMEYLDPLGMTYNGLPLVESRREAVNLTAQYRRT
jgi:hypothetical protein